MKFNENGTQILIQTADNARLLQYVNITIKHKKKIIVKILVLK